MSRSVPSKTVKSAKVTKSVRAAESVQSVKSAKPYQLADPSESSTPILLFNNLAVQITERCTLSCAKCRHLLQYYQSPPRHFGLYYIIQDLQDLFKQPVHIKSLIIVGGEPFLHPYLQPIIEFLQYYGPASAHPVFDRLEIITNCTVPLSESIIQCLSDCHVYLELHNYHGSSEFESYKALIDSGSVYGSIADDPFWDNLMQFTEPTPFSGCHCRISSFVVPWIKDSRFYMCGFHANGCNGLYCFDPALHSCLLTESVSEYVAKYRISGAPACRFCPGSSGEPDLFVDSYPSAQPRSASSESLTPLPSYIKIPKAKPSKTSSLSKSPKC